MNILREKSREVFQSVFPIVVIVILLHLFVTPVENFTIFRFLMGAVFVYAGLTIFLTGVDMAITPIGSSLSRALAKSNKAWVLLSISFLTGFFVAVAEPDLVILADQVSSLTAGALSKTSLIISVSLGFSLMISLGLLRIVYSFSIKKFIFITYLVIFVLTILNPPEFIGVAFDASGSATGALTVPFVMALAFGIAIVQKNGLSAEENSFGLVNLASAGAIIIVLLMNMISPAEISSEQINFSPNEITGLVLPFLKIIPKNFIESFISLLPIFLIFIIFNKLSFNMHKNAYRSVIFGLVYTLIGLTLFLVGVNGGFAEIGKLLGSAVASKNNFVLTLSIGFVLGVVTVLAEPAVHVLTEQIENITAGTVKRSYVMVALCLGVGMFISLSILMILRPEFKLQYFLFAGYAAALFLMRFVSMTFVGMAFDSGAVASGPMTVTFISAFTTGVSSINPSADSLSGFGVIAMVALAPLITMQLLGLIYTLNAKKRKEKA